MKQLLHNNLPLQYETMGTGFPVVLLHGFGEDSSVWAFQKVALQDECRLILPQLPGTGGSALQADMSMEAMAEAVCAILDEEKTDQCIFIGHSMGGYIALAFAAHHPDRLAGLGLFHSSALADTEEKIATRNKGIDFIQTHGAMAFLKTSIPNLYGPATKEATPSLVEEHLASVDGISEAALVAYYRSMIQRPDRTAVLKSVNVPVLLIIGRHDVAVPFEDGLRQAHLPQLCYIHILEASGHMGMREEPETSNQLLRNYISAVRQRTSST